MADAPDSKSGGVHPREGSSPSSGTIKSITSTILGTVHSHSFLNCPYIVRLIL
jgi:hypothetical protein